jgi:hypothetical protein
MRPGYEIARAGLPLLCAGSASSSTETTLVLPCGTIRAISRFISSFNGRQEDLMPRGDKSAYSGKQKRQARHIEKGYEKRGISEGEAERRAWATVNKMTGGGRKSGSGRGKPTNKAPARKGGRLGGRAAARRSAAARSASARKAAATRSRRRRSKRGGKS